MSLSHHMYDPKQMVEAYYKKANFNWSYPHTKQCHEDKFMNWYSASREFSPSEQHEKDDKSLSIPKRT